MTTKDGTNPLVSGKMMGFIPTTDYAKAREFYVEKLGLGFISLDQYALVVQAGEHRIRIGKLSELKPLQATILGWEVPDIEATVDWLRSRGVQPESYPFIQDHDRGIWTTPNGDKVAWFKDPDGNILSVSFHPRPAASGS